MNTIPWIFSTALALGLLGCAYNPALPEEPFLCGPGGKCPSGYSCYGGICRKSLPDCMDPSNATYASWPDDSSLEPNNHWDLAVTLPCGDDPTRDPTYSGRCPTRANYVNGFMNLVICPPKDRDFYKIFLLAEETIVFTVYYKYGDGFLPRDLNARVWRWNDPFRTYEEVAVGQGQSTNDDETITVSTAAGTGLQAGWYYLEVYGATHNDVNIYTVSFTLNPTT